MVSLLTDDHVHRLISMREAIDAIERALASKAAGAFLTPPRHYVRNKNGALVFTIGGDAERGVFGFRVYGAFPGNSEDEQFVAVYDAATGRLCGIVNGARVGAMRTGALGGVAVKYGAREDASVVAVIGSGTQAGTQLEAAAAVRRLASVRVYSRSSENRRSFASRMSALLGIDVAPVASPSEAIAGAHIVLIATNSSAPVFDASLVEPGQHVTTIRLGRGQHELDVRVADRAAAIFTDSSEQLRSYPGGFFLEERIDGITDLAKHVGRREPARSSPDDVTLYLSAGLSGTEVMLAALALDKASGGEP